MTIIVKKSEPLPLFIFNQDGQLPVKAQQLYSELERNILAKIFFWMAKSLTMPHPNRSGSLCPFMPAALKKRQLFLGIENDHDISDDDLEKKLLDFSDKYFNSNPLPGSDDFYTAIVFAIPFHKKEEDIFERMRRINQKIKLSFLEKKRMLGVFSIENTVDHPNSEENNSIPNPLYVFAIRHMVEHDDRFLWHSPDKWLETYRQQFPHLSHKSPEELCEIAKHFIFAPTDQENNIEEKKITNLIKE